MPRMASGKGDSALSSEAFLARARNNDLKVSPRLPNSCSRSDILVLSLTWSERAATTSEPVLAREKEGMFSGRTFKGGEFKFGKRSGMLYR